MNDEIGIIPGVSQGGRSLSVSPGPQASRLPESAQAGGTPALPAEGRSATTASLDPFGRRIDYVRLSITDRCNERCLYCMPEGFKGWRKRDDILSDAEILAAARAFAAEGVTKFRVTGGEPLLRPGVPALIRALHAMPGVREVGLSTNGLLLAPLVPALVAAGLRSVNVSLDALSPETYSRVTGGRVEPVFAAMRDARDAGIRVKVNCVLMRGVNEDEIFPLVERAAAEGWLLRFVELMPLSRTDVLDASNFLPVGQVLRRLRERYTLDRDEVRHGNGPASYWRVKELGGLPLGFIGSITTEHFCDNCNKVRLTADGKLRPCLRPARRARPHARAAPGNRCRRAPGDFPQGRRTQAARPRVQRQPPARSPHDRHRRLKPCNSRTSRMPAVTPLTLLLFLAAAGLYAFVGHGGGSAYAAIMGGLGWPRDDMRVTGLVLNLIVSAIAFGCFARSGRVRKDLLLATAAGGIPCAFLGAKVGAPAPVFWGLIGPALGLAALQMISRR